MKITSLAATDLRDYAKSLGWVLLPEAVKDRLFVLSHPLIPRRQIVLPIDDTAPDYQEAVQIALEKLANLHYLDEALIFSAVQSVRDDTLRYRVTSARYEEDTLPLSFAALLLQGAQQMWLSSACTVFKPQLHHPRLSRNEAQQVIENARFGHTEQGSFILRVSCPVNALDIQTPLPSGEEVFPFVRATTLTIYRAVRQLVDAVEADTLETLVESVKTEPEPLLSSNFCEAMTWLHDEDMRNTIDLDFSWAVGVSMPENMRPHEKIRIQSDYFLRIEEVRRELRAAERYREDTFMGTVEQLNGEMGDDGQRLGEVIVALLLHEGESVRARLNLTADDYKKAIHAHQTPGVFVQIAGRLNPGRQPRQLIDINRFVIVIND